MAAVVVCVLIIMSVFTCDIKFVVFWHMFINIFAGSVREKASSLDVLCTIYCILLSTALDIEWNFLRVLLLVENIFTDNVLAPFC